MNAIDISRLIMSNAPVYPGDPPVIVNQSAAFGHGDAYQLTELSASVHLLTHIDAPRHFFADGQSIDELSLSRFMGPALVIEIESDVITPQHLPPAEVIPRLNILFRTRHSSAPLPSDFDRDHVHLAPEAAEILAQNRANLVGIDYLDIEQYGNPGFPVHRTLLRSGVLILEGLNLESAPAGRFQLLALPLPIYHGDAAPCRAILLHENAG